MTTGMHPTIGRSVHYTEIEGGDARPAVVTHVWSDTCVDLVVFGLHAAPATYIPSAVESVAEPPTARSWAWPVIS
jgi:hypothetical protein